MRETELKGVAYDVARMRQRLEAAGARRAFRGTLVDRRYDTPDRQLRQRDVILRVRSEDEGNGATSRLELKGPAQYPDGFKVREEIGSGIEDLGVVETMLRFLGYEVSIEIERQIEVYTIGEATVRFEHYPRMDVLVEVEGDPGAIESAIEVLGAARTDFSADRLSDFVARYEARTGDVAALCSAELATRAPADRKDA